MDTGLDGRVVWITGASGGIGQALARAFAAEGARLVLHAHRNTGAVRDLVAAANLTDALVVEGDLRAPETAEHIVARARERWGRVDVCVPNHGVWPPDGVGLGAMAPARVRDVLDINLLGAMWCARAFLAQLAELGPRPDGRGASLCFVGSTAGRFGEPGHAAYAASKGALRALVPGLTHEISALDPAGRVNLVEPGWTATPMATPGLTDDSAVRRALAPMPLQRVATPEDIAHAVVFLSSPRLARHVTGEVLTLAGGMQGRLAVDPRDVDPAAIRRAAGARADKP